MMAATKIGERQGQELYKEMQKRWLGCQADCRDGYNPDQLAYRPSTTPYSMDALKAGAFPPKEIYKVPIKSNDIPVPLMRPTPRRPRSRKRSTAGGGG
ncbi:hypothetical protein ACNKHS_11540 [Shigella flexneri]